MIAVITGDIINSRQAKSSSWLPLLKDVLSRYGQEPSDWQIYRGDSFQLRLTPEKALTAALHIKSSVKEHPKLDVRMGIGLGAQSHEGSKVSESFGSAFVLSGECFESLKKQNLAVKSSHADFDRPMNLMLSLALLTMDHWSTTAARVLKNSLENSDKNQRELAQLLQKSQSSISEALKRAGFEELKQMITFYQSQIQTL